MNNDENMNIVECIIGVVALFFFFVLIVLLIGALLV